ncbi:MFS transporter [Haloarcula nitratireducens]|uniref:MFS transporter n=1 Tax=Haloarcula nitratireducens TaxID=2487749 RepID=A0AAW4P8K2_9EURY|nr:MFS transporter [Halomicroarcula nitratireducens]MBX0293637.1 MFS transporter [Halomicroarcula nitratireducens]
MSVRRERAVLAAVVFAVLLAQVLLYPGVDTLVRALGAETDLDASMWFLAAEFAAFVVFAGVWGAVSDAVGRRVPFIVGGAVVGAAFYAALAWLPTVTGISFEGILVLRALQGGATIAAFSLSMTMLMDLEGGHGKNMGAAGIAIGLGTATGAPLGGQLYGVSPTLPLYLASVVLLAVAVLAALVTDRAPSDGENKVAAAVTNLRETPALGIPYAFGFIDRLTAGFFALVGTLYFREAFELTPGETGIMLALFFAPFALLQYPFGVLSDSVGRTVPIVAGSSLYGLAVVGVGLAPTVVLAGAGMVLVGVIGALMSPATMALVTDLAGESGRGTAMAGFNAFGSVGFLAGILVGGTVAGEFGYFAAFVVAGGAELALALVTLPRLLELDLPVEERPTD